MIVLTKASKQPKLQQQLKSLPEPKKRGRKPKPSTNESKIDKGGRPPLARNALVDDTAPVIRRSNRNKK